MAANDIIGDALTRIRNAHQRSYKDVNLIYSKLVLRIAEILKEKGYIEEIEVKEEKVGQSIDIKLKYVDGKPAISNLKRISKPGLRKYTIYKNIPRVLNGLGFAILSTPEGVISDDEARKKNVGGELLCTIY